MSGTAAIVATRFAAAKARAKHAREAGDEAGGVEIYDFDVEEKQQPTKEIPYPTYRDTAFFCLKQTTPPRSYVLKLVSNPWFDRATMFVILLNCVTLAMYRPCGEIYPCKMKCKILEIVDHMIFGYFALEMVLKMFAMGIFGAQAYLTDSWNRLDCFIVIAGSIEYVLKSQFGDLNLTVIRTIRVLRPLRAVNRVPSLRILVSLLLDTLPMLGNVVLLCFFVFFVFAIIGVQLWNGLLRNRCYPNFKPGIFEDSLPDNLPPYYSQKFPAIYEYICSAEKDNGMHECKDLESFESVNGTVCTGSRFNVSEGECVNWYQYFDSCRPDGHNPFGGAISFDNILYALVAVFVLLALNGWVDIMYYVQDAHSFWNWIYFVMLIVIGTFYMLNLFLAVIASQFAETKGREMEKMAAERALEELEGKDKKSKREILRDKFAQAKKDWVARFGICLPARWKEKSPKTEKRRTSTESKEAQQTEQVEPLLPGLNRVNGKPMDYVLQERNKHSPDRIEADEDSRTESEVHGTQSPEKLLRDIKNDLEDQQQDLPIVQNEEMIASQCLSEESDLPTSCPGRFRRRVRQLVDSSEFGRAIMIAIIVNTISMAVEHYEQPALLTLILEYTNYFFTALFSVEMVLKLIAYKPSGYVKDTFNMFDGTIVIVSLIELFQGGEGGLSVLRTFRLFRVFKLVRFIPSLRYQLVIMIKCVNNVTFFFVLLCLFIFIFTLLGMVVFGGKFCTKLTEDGDRIQCNCTEFMRPDTECKCLRWNFDTFLHAALTVFIVLTGCWCTILYDGMARVGPWAGLYFICLLAFGNYILFNLLVGILLEGFQDTSEDEVMAEADEELEEELRSKKSSSAPSKLPSPTEPSAIKFESRICTCYCDGDAIENLANDELQRSRVEPEHQVLNHSAPEWTRNNPSMEQPLTTSVSYGLTSSVESSLHKPGCPMYTELPMIQSGTTALIEDSDIEPKKNKIALCCTSCYENSFLGKRRNYSLYLLSPENSFRKKCLHIISLKSFDYTVLFFIGINCITFAMERPAIQDGSFERQFLTISNYFFTAIFTAEMTIKVLAKGLIIGNNTYFRDSWNILDGLLVIVSLISILFEFYMQMANTGKDPPKIFGVIRVLRLLRALRPLRVINRAPGLKVVVQTLIGSLKPIGSVLLICGLFFIIFGILGVQLFSGKFHRCEGPTAKNVTNKFECLANRENVWEPPKYNFDHLGIALLSLFVLSTLDNWNELMYQGMDVVGVNQQPIMNNSEYNLLFFIAFVLVVGFFVLNMFVGVVVENFQKNCKEVEEQQREQLAALAMEKMEKNLEKAAKEKLEMEFWRSYGPTRLKLYNFVTNKYFDLAIAGIIGLNVFTMAIEHYDMSRELVLALQILNYIFTAVFAIEAVLKLGALGFKGYFKDGWNRFDMFIVIASFAGIALEEMKSGILPINPTMIRVMRVLRIARVLKLLKMAEGIRSLLDCVGKALPSVGNLAVLFLLLFYIFAALGVELFGRIECSDEHPCLGMNEHANFSNFGIAFLTLFRVATGDNWSGILADTMKGNCESSESCKTNCCVGAGVGPFYFIIFVLFSAFVLMNLVVAVLLKYLEESKTDMLEEEEGSGSEGRYAADDLGHKKLRLEVKKLQADPFPIIVEEEDRLSSSDYTKNLDLNFETFELIDSEGKEEDKYRDVFVLNK